MEKLPERAAREKMSLPAWLTLLSEREVEVLRLLASGLPPAEVAKKLYLSPFTLKAHTQNIYTKLGVHSRIEAINKAREFKSALIPKRSESFYTACTPAGWLRS